LGLQDRCGTLYRSPPAKVLYHHVLVDKGDPRHLAQPQPLAVPARAPRQQRGHQALGPGAQRAQRAQPSAEHGYGPGVCCFSSSAGLRSASAWTSPDGCGVRRAAQTKQRVLTQPAARAVARPAHACTGDKYCKQLWRTARLAQQPCSLVMGCLVSERILLHTSAGCPANQSLRARRGCRGVSAAPGWAKPRRPPAAPPVRGASCSGPSRWPPRCRCQMIPGRRLWPPAGIPPRRSPRRRIASAAWRHGASAPACVQ
jgi:hypothetical protein